jgi:serine/threonine protein kinase
VNSLNHNNIIKYFNFFNEENYSYLVMEKVDGGDLFERIAKKSKYARDLASIILNAIKHMHDQNIIRRLTFLLFIFFSFFFHPPIHYSFLPLLYIIHVLSDLKLVHLMFTTDSNDVDVKIVDFHSATTSYEFDQNLPFGTSGTYCNMAPVFLVSLSLCVELFLCFLSCLSPVFPLSVKLSFLVSQNCFVNNFMVNQ